MASDQELAATLEDEPRPAAATRVHAAQLPRGTTIHRYVLIDKVGQGGMGVVYAAYDQMLHRRVAVKLVASRASQGDPRLLGEARAMAQLQHAAIVPVHDVGEFAGQLFLAMAFIEGKTLRAWQFEEGRRWPEIVAMYRQLAEGLAFAHDQGIVHRDFKPDNVLVDEAGRPHITDFGLAKIAAVAEPATPARDAPSDTVDTITGTIAGTPGYMSPQQSRGEQTDARTDQYAFCASLFEALHRGLPRDQPPARTDVPRRILAAIERGLAEDPDKRWPSMRALIAELAPPEPPRRRRALLGAAVLAAGLATWLALRPGTKHEACDAPQARAMWQASRAQVSTAFARQGAQADELVGALDDWTARWTDMAQSSCRATASGSQSAQLLDLRARCLDHALDITTSLVELASQASRSLVSRASHIANELPRLEPCADTAGLLGLAPLPADPARRGVITEVRKRIAKVWALLEVESYKAASAELDALAGPVQATAYAPLAFEFYQARAATELELDSHAALAAAAAWQAIASDPGRADYEVANVWIDLVWIVGEMQHDPKQGLDLGRVAEAIATRVQNRRQLARLDHRLGFLLADVGRTPEAIARFERAIAAFEAMHDQAAELASLQGEAVAASALGDHAKAIALYERAIAIAATLPHRRVALATLLSAESITYREMNRLDEALAALARAQEAIGDGREDPALLAGIHANRGNIWEAKGDLAAAEAEYRAQLEIARASLDADSDGVQTAWFNVGQIQNQRHTYGDALASLEQCAAISRGLSKQAVESGTYVSRGLIARQLVIAQLGLGHASDALAAAEQSLAAATGDGARPAIVADVHFALATAAWATGDHARARDAMKLASAEYRESGGDPQDADDWLKAH